MLVLVIAEAVVIVGLFVGMVKVVKQFETLKEDKANKKEYKLIINTDGEKDKRNWAARSADLITDVVMKKIDIDGEPFWKITYIEDGLECEVIDPEPMRYSLRLGKKEE